MWWCPNCVLTNHIFLFKWAFKVKDTALQHTLGVETNGSQVSILQLRPNHPRPWDLKHSEGGCYACECPHQSFHLLQGLLFLEQQGMFQKTRSACQKHLEGPGSYPPFLSPAGLKERILLRTRWKGGNILGPFINTTSFFKPQLGLLFGRLRF